VKYKDFVINSFQENQRKPCGLPTDRPKYRLTDISKTIYPSSSKGRGHNKKQTAPAFESRNKE
jgi:hypothetical protein